MHAALLAAVAAAEHARQLPVAPIVYAVTAFGGLVALLLVTYAFRSVGTRH